MTTAQDIMQAHIIRVDPETPLLEVYRLFARESISGAPVVDETGKVVGVVSMSDLIRTTEDERDAVHGVPMYFREDSSYSSPEWLPDVEDFEDRLSRRTVAEVMTTDVISVAPKTPVPEIVKVVTENRIHRVLVLDPESDEQSLVGILSLFDLVALLGE